MNSRRNALGVGVLCVLPLGALPTLLGEPKPGSISELMPDWLAAGWALALFVGPLIALVGIAMRNAAHGVEVEAVGVAVLVAPTFLYATVALAYNGYSAALTAAAFYGISAACLWRAIQCVRALRKAKLLDNTWLLRKRR